MKVITDWRAFPAELRGGVLCVGNFDGVHAGHRRMLETGKAEAVRRGVSFTIMTFDPHPGAVLRPEGKRLPLTTFEQRRELLAEMGAQVLVVVPTTRDFLGRTAEEFLNEVVAAGGGGGGGGEGIGAKVMVEGPTFTFGRGAKGTVAMLQERGREFGVEAVIVPTEQVALSDLTLVGVSSSLIRWLVENGRVADAGKCLGRAYALRGEVVHGAQRGRAIGFPTANVATGQLLPGAGVYAGRALVDGEVFLAAISVGTNPTFHGTLTTVEAYLLDFAGDLYGKMIELQFVRWVREMLTFGGVEPLIKQIAADVAVTRDVMQRKESA